MRHKKKRPDKTTAYSNFIEISIDPTLFNNFSNDHSIGSFLNCLTTSEEFQKLRNELIKELLNIINTELTEKQKKVILMTYIEGKTQMEIADILGTHQTATHKSLKGNVDYKHGEKRYGGAIKKIQKLCTKNKKIQSILTKIKEKNEELNAQ